RATNDREDHFDALVAQCRGDERAAFDLCHSRIASAGGNPPMHRVYHREGIVRKALALTPGLSPICDGQRGASSHCLVQSMRARCLPTAVGLSRDALSLSTPFSPSQRQQRSLLLWRRGRGMRGPTAYCLGVFCASRKATIACISSGVRLLT